MLPVTFCVFIATLSLPDTYTHAYTHTYFVRERREREKKSERELVCVCVCLENRTLKISNFSQHLPHTASLLLPPPHIYVYVNTFGIPWGM